MSDRSLSMNRCRVTAHDSRVRFAGARIALLLAGTACSDPSATRACAPRFVGQVQHVPGVPIDLPPEPRPWDTSAAALEEAIAREDGHAVIAFKAPDSARAVDTGWRAALPAGAIEQGFDLLAATLRRRRRLLLGAWRGPCANAARSGHSATPQRPGRLHRAPAVA